MKRILVLLLTISFCISIMSCSIFCEHKWKNGKCLSCNTVCSHQWVAATCITPKHCPLCGHKTGEVNTEHNLIDDKCQDCGIIVLNLNNFKKYVDCSASVRVGNYISGPDKYDTLYTSAKCVFEAIGNSHYKYNDVKITVKFYHFNSYKDQLDYMLDGSADPYSTSTITIQLNLAGNGSGYTTVSTNWITDSGYNFDYVNSTKALFNRTEYSIISIEGTVEEY